MPKLILTTEAQGKVAYEFAECLITIGRAPDNMIVVDHRSVSSRHGQLELSRELIASKIWNRPTETALMASRLRKPPNEFVLKLAHVDSREFS
jgi:hypothetical protein